MFEMINYYYTLYITWYSIYKLQSIIFIYDLLIGISF